MSRQRPTSSSALVCCRPACTPNVVMPRTVDSSAMPNTHANGIDIEWDDFGDRDDPTLLLIMGLGAQMIAWEPELCRMLADRGFHVVRFDNRATGLSTKIEHGPPPDVPPAFAGH